MHLVVSVAKQFLSDTLDEKMTWQFLQDAWRNCSHCGAHWRMLCIKNYMTMWNDGQIHCGHCNTYLGVWDNKEGILDWNERTGTATSLVLHKQPANEPLVLDSV